MGQIEEAAHKLGLLHSAARPPDEQAQRTGIRYTPPSVAKQPLSRQDPLLLPVLGADTFVGLARARGFLCSARNLFFSAAKAVDLSV